MAGNTPEGVQLTGGAGERLVGADKVEGVVRSRSVRRVGASIK
jgi:hypothetical protein